MYNFTFNIPTKIHFGKDTISSLSELKAYGSKVLLVYFFQFRSFQSKHNAVRPQWKMIFYDTNPSVEIRRINLLLLT